MPWWWGVIPMAFVWDGFGKESSEDATCGLRLAAQGGRFLGLSGGLLVSVGDGLRGGTAGSAIDLGPDGGIESMLFSKKCWRLSRSLYVMGPGFLFVARQSVGAPSCFDWLRVATPGAVVVDGKVVPTLQSSISRLVFGLFLEPLGRPRFLFVGFSPWVAWLIPINGADVQVAIMVANLASITRKMPLIQQLQVKWDW